MTIIYTQANIYAYKGGGCLMIMNLLQSDVRISIFHDHKYFLVEGDLVNCNDIDGLMTALNITNNPDE